MGRPEHTRSPSAIFCLREHRPPPIVRAVPGTGHHQTISHDHGAVAQLGERYTGSVEVDGSIPFGSTKFYKGLGSISWALILLVTKTVTTW